MSGAPEIGIGAVHCLLPRQRVPVAELPELATLGHEEVEFVGSSGIRTVGVFPDAPASEWAVRACRALPLDSSDQPDVMVLVAPRSPDVLLGSDAGRVQADGKLTPQLWFTVDGLGCAGSSAAWGLARDLLVADRDRRSVLIVHTSRPTGADRVRYPVTVIGDGAFAMTMVRGGRPVLRAHRVRTDGSFHDLFRVDYRQAPWYEWREECASPDRYRFELAMCTRGLLGPLVDQVLADAGVTRDRIAATVMQNLTAAGYAFHETLLRLPIHRLCATHLGEYGHLGAMDVVLNLDRLLAGGSVASGDLVLVVNNSPVAAWAVSLWEV
jgi:3-oxoacyl-[acyl-carrier-protein] synthase-3